MKNVIVVIIATCGIMTGCNQTSNKEVIKADENLAEAKTELQDAQENKNEADKEKATAEWKYFKNEADSSIESLQKDLNKLTIKIEKAGKNEKRQLKADYTKAENNIVAIRERLNQRNIAFESEMERFDNTVSEKNQSFQREFKHDMEELGKSMKDLFKDNVK
jgi:hypothetical protein